MTSPSTSWRKYTSRSGSRSVGNGTAVRDADRLGDDVLVRHRYERYAHTGEASDLSSEHATAVDDDLALDHALIGSHRTGASVDDVDPDRPGCVDGQRRPGPRATHERVTQLGRIEVAVGVEEARTDDAVQFDERESLGDLGGRDLVQRQAVRARPADLAADLFEAFARRCELDPAALRPADREPARLQLRYNSTEYMFIRVRVGSARSCPTRPAEWNVDPLVNSSRSRTTTSDSPSSARWNATLAPPTPPPITTTRAADGSEVLTLR